MNDLDILKLVGKNSLQTLISTIVRSLFIVSYGHIVAIGENETVQVEVAVKSSNRPECTAAKYFSLASAVLNLRITPTVGDKVLLLSPKDWKVSMLTETTSVQGSPGYSVNACFAIPMGKSLDTSTTSINVTDTSISIVAGSSDKEVSVSENISGDKAVNAKSIDLNGGEDKDDNLIRYSELNTALQNFVTSLKTSLETTPIAGNGSTQVWTNFPTLDISKALCSTLTTGKTDPSN